MAAYRSQLSFLLVAILVAAPGLSLAIRDSGNDAASSQPLSGLLGGRLGGRRLQQVGEPSSANGAAASSSGASNAPLGTAAAAGIAGSSAAAAAAAPQRVQPGAAAGIATAQHAQPAQHAIPAAVSTTIPQEADEVLSQSQYARHDARLQQKQDSAEQYSSSSRAAIQSERYSSSSEEEAVEDASPRVNVMSSRPAQGSNPIADTLREVRGGSSAQRAELDDAPTEEEPEYSSEPQDSYESYEAPEPEPAPQPEPPTPHTHVTQHSVLNVEGKSAGKYKPVTKQRTVMHEDGSMELINIGKVEKEDPKEAKKKKQYERLAKYYTPEEDSDAYGDSGAYDSGDSYESVSTYARPSNAARYNKAAAKAAKKAVIMSSSKTAAGAKQAEKPKAGLAGLFGSKAAAAPKQPSVAAASRGGYEGYEGYEEDAYAGDSYDYTPHTHMQPGNGTMVIESHIKGHVKGKEAMKKFKGGKQHATVHPDGSVSVMNDWDEEEGYGYEGKQKGYKGPSQYEEEPEPYYYGDFKHGHGYYDDLDHGYYWSPESNAHGSKLRKREAKNVYNFRTRSEEWNTGTTTPLASSDPARLGAGGGPVVLTYTTTFTCGAGHGAPPSVGECLGTGIAPSKDATTAQMTFTCTIHEDASNLCGLRYVQGMIITAQGQVTLGTNDLSHSAPRLSGQMLPITGVYMPNRRTTLLADAITLLSGIKGGTLMFDSNMADDDTGFLTFYFWR